MATGWTRMMVLDGTKGTLEARVASSDKYLVIFVRDEGNRSIKDNCRFLVCVARGIVVLLSFLTFSLVFNI